MVTSSLLKIALVAFAAHAMATPLAERDYTRRTDITGQCNYQNDGSTVKCVNAPLIGGSAGNTVINGPKPGPAIYEREIVYNMRDIDEAAVFMRRADAEEFLIRDNLAVRDTTITGNANGANNGNSCSLTLRRRGNPNYTCNNDPKVGSIGGNTVINGRRDANNGNNANKCSIHVRDGHGTTFICDNEPTVGAIGGNTVENGPNPGPVTIGKRLNLEGSHTAYNMASVRDVVAYHDRRALLEGTEPLYRREDLCPGVPVGPSGGHTTLNGPVGQSVYYKNAKRCSNQPVPPTAPTVTMNPPVAGQVYYGH